MSAWIKEVDQQTDIAVSRATLYSMDKNVTHSISKERICCEHNVRVSVCSHTWLTFRTVGASSSLSLFIAATGVSLKYGGSPSTISTTMIPIDQISTWCIIIQLHYVADVIAHIATVGIHATWEWSPLFFSVTAFECVPPHLSAIWWFGDNLRSHPIGCPH